ncbi:MAG: glycosyltransferase family 2 protein [Calditrichaceae bacterium]|nr:glycosyltransferase family 2 protein [Calditrichia bacterium]NUQ40194.1 glycosyltransferase family 2 protein [Calditrichaceae bacterium]
MMKISVVIITYNEEKNIERCLRSVQNVADEIVVVDSFSTDHTREICEKFGAKIFQRKWQGYSHTKNFGNEMANYDQVLSIDADEALTPDLEASILKLKAKSTGGIYSFNRLTNYCGQWIRHCGWYPDVKIRLFNRTVARWEGEYVHEKLAFEKSFAVHHLKGDLLHFSFASLADHLQRVNRYTDLAAREMLERKTGGLVFKMILSPLAKFVKSYFFKRGFQDGFHGLCVCTISAFDVFIRYAKAIQMQRESVGRR